jgi:type I restriction enzyme R subunit
VADLLRDSFKRSKYPDVILPFTVLRRIDCVLEPTKPKVLEAHAKLKDKLDNLAPQLRRAAGYRKRTPDEYNRTLCLDPGIVLEFIYATQPQEWEKLKAQHGGDVKAKFLQRLATEIAKRGTLDVLRKGIKDSGSKFQLAYFKPATGLNPDTQTLYAANQFSIIRQLRFSEKTEQSVDLALFLNGIPLFTAELKNPLTGQTVENAITQYRKDRDPKEPLFAFGRCLAHFAVDPDLVFMTTHLQEGKTRFLPYNKGRNGGAGNPPSALGFATAYLWEQTWSRDSVLDLIQNFVQVVEEEDDKGKKTGKFSMVFPRYHQLDCVRRLVADGKKNGPGQRYLIQHSAGSGKSNSISWLAHQLSALHDAQQKRVFDSIVIITDRRILDRQLQRTVRAFEQTLGLVENIDTTSRQLKQALEDGKTIIVTTLQKFPVIAKDMGEMPGRRFAVIIDEAHSSQSGETTKGWKSVLAVKSLENGEEGDEEEAEDLEDKINEEARKRGRLPNVSIFAFTATPKPKTMELFGVKRDDGKYEPFSLYTMRQAIEEGFILDVLKNYTTYKAYWSLLKKVKDDPRYERKKAYALLRSFVDHHEATVKKKVAIMVDHFIDHALARVGGKAKAMIVCRSRPQAVLYKQVVDEYLKTKGGPFKALVAFSGTVKHKAVEYTEAGMNSTPEEKIGDTQTAEAFKRDEYRFLIVANKFQTGFDQPLLHTMYVDKKLGGVNAVQTLSRLNRTCPNKEETVVLDFANDAEEIQAAFEPYYDRTLLSEGTDPNLLYDLQTRLAEYHLFTTSEVNAFAAVWFDPKGTQDKLHAVLQPAVDRFGAAEQEERQQFRSQLGDFVRLYSFLSQVVTFTDADLEKLYLYGRLLLRKLPVKHDQLPVEIQQNIDVDSYRVQQTSSGRIKLDRGTAELEPITGGSIFKPPPEEVEALSLILKTLNDRFGTDFSQDDKVFIQQLEEKLAGDAALEASVKVNVPENARLTFDHVANDKIQEMIDSNFKFYKQVTDDPAFEKFFLDWLFERYKKSAAGKTV